ncbi:uncharacterized protein [Elaeis guineensis]|uniref:uncharacterized protein isoform X2 n=1 Tax=Elaeis guineensis var. tenera TaxID=51953 RepID=UPI003C6D3787
MNLVFVLAFLQTIDATAITSFLKASNQRSDKFNFAKNVDDRLANHEVHEESDVVETERGGAADNIVLISKAEYTEVHCLPGAAGPLRVRQTGSTQGSLGRNEEHHHSLAGTSYGKEDEHHPTTSMLQTLPEELDLPVATIGRDAPEPADDNGVIDMNSELQHRSQGEMCCGGEDECPTACMLQNPPEEQPDFPIAITEPAEDNRAINMNSELDGREQRHREIEVEEEMKHALKFSYFSTGIAGAGIVGIFSGYLGAQTGQAHTIHLKVCTFFMLATFIAGASMLVLTFLHLSSRVSIKIFRSLKYTTLGFLTLTMFDISFFLLKNFAILAFVPTLFVVMIAFFMALCHNGLPWSHHQGNSSMSFDR